MCGVSEEPAAGHCFVDAESCARRTGFVDMRSETNEASVWKLRTYLSDDALVLREIDHHHVDRRVDVGGGKRRRA